MSEGQEQVKKVESNYRSDRSQGQQELTKLKRLEPTRRTSLRGSHKSEARRCLLVLIHLVDTLNSDVPFSPECVKRGTAIPSPKIEKKCSVYLQC